MNGSFPNAQLRGGQWLINDVALKFKWDEGEGNNDIQLSQDDIIRFVLCLSSIGKPVYAELNEWEMKRIMTNAFWL